MDELKVVNKLGDMVYYEILLGIIIEARIIEIEDIWVLSERLVSRFDLKGDTLCAYKHDPAWCLWEKCYSEKRYDRLVGYGKGEGYGFRYFSTEEIDFGECRHINQFVGIDEPVGHSLTIGSDLYTNIREALKQASWIPRREAHNPRKKVWASRRRSMDFIYKTQGNPPESECFPFEELINPNKRIWTKTRRSS